MAYVKYFHADVILYKKYYSSDMPYVSLVRISQDVAAQSPFGPCEERHLHLLD